MIHLVRSEEAIEANPCAPNLVPARGISFMRVVEQEAKGTAGVFLNSGVEQMTCR